MFATHDNVPTSDATRSARPTPPPLPRPVVLYEFAVEAVDAKTRKGRTLVTTVVDEAEARDRAVAYGLRVITVKRLGVAEAPGAEAQSAAGAAPLPRPVGATGTLDYAAANVKSAARKPNGWMTALGVLCFVLFGVFLIAAAYAGVNVTLPGGGGGKKEEGVGVV